MAKVKTGIYYPINTYFPTARPPGAPVTRPARYRGRVTVKRALALTAVPALLDTCTR